MKVIAGHLLLLAVASARQAVTPVDRVITLLTKLTAQVQAEGLAEADSYDKYACFCKDHADEKVYVIAKSDKLIKELDADITALEGEITSLDDAVGKLGTEIDGEEKTQKDNAEARAKAQAKYEKERKSLVEAIDAVDAATKAMQESKVDIEKQLSSLLQKLPSHSHISKPTLALIAGASTGLRNGAAPGEAAAYRYDSKEVIQALQELTVTFKKELADLDETDFAARSDYEMAAGARANKITALKKDKEEKEKLSASKSVTKGEKENDREEETAAMNADQKFLTDLTNKCEAKAKAWDQRSTTRASELTALTQGVQLLKGMGDDYNANSKLVGLLSKGSQAAVAQHAQPMLLQLRSVHHLRSSAEKLQELAGLLNNKAHSLNSAPLAMLALQLETSGPDHFVKVRGIISDLIAKLKADAEAEATSKGICDKNMKAAIDKRDKSAGEIETANAQIDVTKAAISSLEEEIEELAKQIAALNKLLLDAKELRAKEKAQNAKTLEDAKSGQEAVNDAVGLLKKFYGEALVQVGAGQTPNIENREGKTVGDLAPETFSSDEEYKGKVDASKGIIGMLEVIASDFSRTIEVVTADDEASEKAYQEIKTDTEKEVGEKTKLKGDKETDVKTKNEDLTGFKGDLKTATKMHEEADEELDKLKKSCVDGDETYAERVQHRKDEIEALKQALQILEDWQN